MGKNLLWARRDREPLDSLATSNGELTANFGTTNSFPSSTSASKTRFPLLPTIWNLPLPLITQVTWTAGLEYHLGLQTASESSLTASVENKLFEVLLIKISSSFSLHGSRPSSFSWSLTIRNAGWLPKSSLAYSAPVPSVFMTNSVEKPVKAPALPVGREEIEKDSTEIGRQRERTAHWSRPEKHPVERTVDRQTRFFFPF